MSAQNPGHIARRSMLKGTAAAAVATGIGAAAYWVGGVGRVSRSVGKKSSSLGLTAWIHA
ncbi:MAG: twin-arginine translocation signal domain-containing protein [Planctomycetaceae bacterium]